MGFIDQGNSCQSLSGFKPGQFTLNHLQTNLPVKILHFIIQFLANFRSSHYI